MTPQQYWEKKILSWEMCRYSLVTAALPITWSLRKRLSIAKNWIEERVRQRPGASVADLGCGSGILAQRLNHKLPFFYVGIDFSETAIRTAKQKKFPSQFRFIASPLEQVLPFQADFTVALGLTDWLEERTLERLFAEIRSEDLLISYTSTGQNLRHRLYRLYRQSYDRNRQSARSFHDDEFYHIYSKHDWSLHQDLSNFWTTPGKVLWLRRTTSM